MKDRGLIHKGVATFRNQLHGPVVVHRTTISCDGDGEHPLVYYTLKEGLNGECSAHCHYCGTEFVFQETVENRK